MAQVQHPDNMTYSEREPARLIGYVAALATAVIALLVSLGVAIPDGVDGQVQTIIQLAGTIVVIVIPIIQAERTRRKVVPVAKIPTAQEDVPYVPAVVDAAKNTPVAA